ncbi:MULTISPECIES: hypothetical protein [unclassified Thioclava]|uniref:hypothetical protein n=1 Tax=unclassified Thioclava TaxID=2621713 RepID=UPI000996CD21|nr:MULTISPECIES: hypothetical protein [unclassified Thioclava]MPQ95487.1 hypothetical protein [Thioclava sp. JE_KL1]OOY02952.1 hypothetical protein BMI87_20240 [Thioclava sp. F28-4]OOY16313.1 hypothetical protein BMI85_12485 [Thioclava sp. DLFJ4-1]
MTKFFTGAIAVAATLAGALPGAAQDLQAPANLSHDALVAWAKANNVCETAVSDAVYNADGNVAVTCTPKATKSTLSGATPVAAVIIGVGLAAAAMGSGGGTSGTNGTNGTN